MIIKVVTKTTSKKKKKRVYKKKEKEKITLDMIPELNHKRQYSIEDVPF